MSTPRAWVYQILQGDSTGGGVLGIQAGGNLCEYYAS
jgi:hypothetical protein